MDYKIVVSADALRQIDLAECYFRAKGIESSFLKDLNKAFIYLEKFPLSRQIKYKSVRIHLLGRFNYSLHYTVEKEKVFILYFLNRSQNF